MGCGDTGKSATAATERSLAERLRGRTFVSSVVTGRDLVDGTVVHIGFGPDGRLHAYAGGNHIEGRTRWDGECLLVGQLVITEMACERSIMVQDEWLSRLLQAGMDAHLEGSVLALAAPGVRLELVDRRSADPGRPLEGTTWKLNGVISGTGAEQALSLVPEEISATLLVADSRMHFFDGCSHHGATVTVLGNSVQVRGEVTSSPVGSQAAEAVSVDMSVLTRDFRYQISGHQLTVIGTGDGLLFVAMDECRVRPTFRRCSAPLSM